MYFYLPAWLDLDELFQAAVDYKQIKPFKKEHLFYILSQFIVVPSINNSLLDHQGFLTLNAQLLRKYVRNYNQYLKFLHLRGVVAYPNHSGYKPGHMSKRYKLVTPDSTYETTPVAIKATDSVLIKKYNRFMRQKNEVKNLDHLTKWLLEPGLEIEIDKAIAFDQQQLRRKIETGIWDISIKAGLVVRKDPRNQSMSTLAAIMRINRRDLYLSVDGKGHRLHTNLTNIPKGMRQFLKYKGSSLGAIDIKNSQPYLSLILLNPHFWTGAGTCFSAFWTKRNIKIKREEPLIMLPQLSQETKNQDVKQFTNLVANGLLYEEFATQLTLHLKRPFSRDQAKTELLRVFFSDNRYFIQEGAESKRIFKEIFPTVYNVFRLIKKGNKPLLACLLQQIESYLILHVICKRIAKEYPLLPIFTIHDSIVTFVEYIPVVKKIMHEELAKFIGFSPSLSEEIWGLLDDTTEENNVSSLESH